MLAQFQRAAPLALPDVSMHQREITAAWLEAGAPESLERLPPKDAPFWTKLRCVTDGRPLLLGVAAAAIARQQEEPDISSMVRLLRPLLDRELRRWREASPSPAMFGLVVGLIAVATQLRGLPIPMGEDHLVAVLVVDDKKQVVLLENKQRKIIRLPTFNEVSRMGDSIINSSIGNHVSSIKTALGTIIPPDSVSACLNLAHNLCPY